MGNATLILLLLVGTAVVFSFKETDVDDIEDSADLVDADEDVFSRYARSTYRRRNQYTNRRPTSRVQKRGRRQRRSTTTLCPQVDLMILIDKSGSQQNGQPSNNCTGEKTAFVQTLINLLVDGTHPGYNHRYGLVTFSTNAHKIRGWTPAVGNSDVRVASCGGKTSILKGLEEAFQVVRQNDNPDSDKILVIQTEGAFNDDTIGDNMWANELTVWKDRFTRLGFQILVAAYGDQQKEDKYVKRRSYLATAPFQKNENTVDLLAKSVSKAITNHADCKSMTCEETCPVKTKKVCKHKHSNAW